MPYGIIGWERVKYMVYKQCVCASECVSDRPDLLLIFQRKYTIIGLVVRPHQLDVSFREYGRSIFGQSDL